MAKTINNGLVEVIDRGQTPAASVQMFPVDVPEAVKNGGLLADDKPRFVPADSWDGSLPSDVVEVPAPAPVVSTASVSTVLSAPPAK